MPYEQVTKIKARDGSLHDTLEAAQAHDARREREYRREQTIERLRDLLWRHVNDWSELPVEYDNSKYPTQNAIAETVFDHFESIRSVIEEGTNQ